MSMCEMVKMKMTYLDEGRAETNAGDEVHIALDELSDGLDAAACVNILVHFDH